MPDTSLSIGSKSHMLKAGRLTVYSGVIAVAEPRNYTPTMLGRWMKYVRESKGLSQTEVAARIEMMQSEWSKWETGERRNPKADKLIRFAEALGVPVSTMALAFAGIWPGDQSPVELPDDPVTLIEQIAALTDHLDRLMRADQESREPRRSTAAQA